QGLALYGYDVTTGTTTPYPSEKELQFALMELQLLNLKQASSTINAVINKLDKLGNKKSSCNCDSDSDSGKSSSSGRYETKSVTGSRLTKSRGLFATAYEQVQADAAYESFCSK